MDRSGEMEMEIERHVDKKMRRQRESDRKEQKEIFGKK
jgi:hypothetical protein